MENKLCNVNNCKKQKMKGMKYCYIHKNRQRVCYNYKENKLLYPDYVNEFFNGCQDNYCIFCKYG